jgi:hypothetical protein
MELIIEGVIKRVCKPMEFESGFRKCEVHVEVQDGKYPQTLSLEFLKDDVDEAVALPQGKTIKARCNVRGSEWQKDDTQPMRVFMSLVPWKYEIVESGAQPAPTQQPSEDGGNFPF